MTEFCAQCLRTLPAPGALSMSLVCVNQGGVYQACWTLLDEAHVFAGSGAEMQTESVFLRRSIGTPCMVPGQYRMKSLKRAGNLCCGETRQACFCSHSCQVHAEHIEGSASLALRRRLFKVPWASISPDDRNHVRFLLHALALRDASQHNHGAARKWERLLALQALPQSLMPDLGRVWKVIQQVCSPDISLEDVSYLLRREACNSFGIMAPMNEQVCISKASQVAYSPHPEADLHLFLPSSQCITY